MDQVTRAFDILLDSVIAFGAFCMTFVYQAEAFLRARMTELGWASNIQTVLLVALTVLAILILLRLFAPVLRVLLILFLLILAIQFLHPENWRRAHAAASCRPACTLAT